MFKLRSNYIILMLIGVTILTGFGDSSLAGVPPPIQGCGITITKVAQGAGDTEFFPFEVSVDGDVPINFTLVNGQSDGGPFNSNVTVTELPLEGWTLRNIECEGDSGISFRIGDDGFRAVCNSDGSFATCTFFNERVVSNIPTLSEWGMIAAAAGLGLIGLFFALNRRKTQAGA